MALFLSENCDLKSPKDLVSRKGSKKYKQIRKGRPLSIVYLYFYLKSKDLKHGTDALMISHFIKSKSKMEKAPEIVSYFDENCPLKDGKDAKINNFDPQKYGHRLVYYAKSYMDQNIDFTTKVMDIHQMTSDKKIVKKFLENAIPLVAGAANLPTFLIPVVNAGKNKNLIGQVIDLVFSLVHPKKSVLKSDPVSLAKDRPGLDLIQSGRFVVIPKLIDTKEKRKIRKNFKLNKGHRLVEKKKPDKEYSKSSYYVFQINGKPIKGYEDFEIASGTAKILSNVIGQKQIDLSSIATEISNAVKSKNDMDSLKKLLKKKLPQEEKNALTNLLSDEAKEIAEEMEE